MILCKKAEDLGRGEGGQDEEKDPADLMETMDGDAPEQGDAQPDAQGRGDDQGQGVHFYAGF